MSKANATNQEESEIDGKENASNSTVPQKKRRLSKKEQKQLKKQRKKSRAQKKYKKNETQSENQEGTEVQKESTSLVSSQDQCVIESETADPHPSKDNLSNENKESFTSNERADLQENKAQYSDNSEDRYDYLQDYTSIEQSAQHPSSTNTSEHKPDGEGLGKWFPTAKIIKPSQTTVKKQEKDEQKKESCTILLFYQYATPQWSKEKVDQLISLLVKIGQVRGLGGRIRVANEGVNATISCIGESIDNTNSRHGCIQIRHFAEDLRRFDPVVFAQTDFKYMDFLPTDRHFKDFKILPVQELVFYGIQEKDAPLSNGGVHLPPKEYHQKLGKKDCVVIDVRNHYEAAIGRFDGQMRGSDEQKSDKKSKRTKNGDKERGAEYIDPLMRKSTDFTAWLDKDETQEKLKGKEVLMYCTGGVRCERASAYLKTKMGEKLQLKGVYQLQGGIEKYLKEFPDGGYWKGKNFVFDKREAISADNPNGDGGVVRKKKKNNNGKIDAEVGAVCCCCGSPWDRYIGKKKCFTCGVPVLMCDKCMSKKPDKTKGLELTVRCPLCKKEGITIPANDVEYTENGKKSKEKNCMFIGDDECKREKKAASSVLKWGGGHATKKKEMRKMKRKMCRFGSECVRKDCFFAH